MNPLASVLVELEQGDFQSRWEIAKQIPDFGESAIAALVDLLHKTPEDPELQWFIARILGQFQHPEAVIALVNLLESAEDEDVVEMAAQMLAQMGSSAISPLTLLLDNPQSGVLVIPALAQIHNVALIPCWLSVMADADAHLRAIAMAALGRFQDPRIIPALLQGLKDVSAKVRQEAVAGISYRAPLFLEHDHDPVALIQPFLEDFDLQVCQQAALALGRLATDAAAQALLLTATATNTPMALKLTIVEALGQIGSHQSIQFLQQLWPYSSQSLQILDDSHPVLAKAIIKALTFNHQTALQAQEDFDLQVCQQAALALGRLATDAAAQALLLTATATNTPMALKLTIVEALGQIGSHQSIQFLQQLWPYSSQSLQILDDSHPVLAKAIIKALTFNHQTALQAQSASVLIHCLHHQPCPDQVISKAIANALGQLGNPQAIPELIGLLETPDQGVRLHAIAALKQIAPDNAYSQLQALAQDTSLERRLKEGVVMALQEW